MEWMYLFLILCLFMVEIECGGKLWLKLVNFSNSRGKGANNHYCDGKFFIRGSDCDHRFIICLDTINGPQNTNVCGYGRWSTATTFNKNSFTFGSRIGSSPNPKTFSFNRWSGSCKLKIDIYDDDDNRDDYVDYMAKYYFKYNPDYNETTAIVTTLSLSHRVRMTVQIKVYCDPDYYGRGCDIYCKQSEKYTCNKINGAKICTTDWTGSDCDVKKDACVSGPCQNEATCHNSMGTYLCVCKEGYTGLKCENEIDECASFPCKNNGTCVDLINNYTCTCPYGYSGEDCDSLTDLCKKNPCLSNSTCMMDPNDVKFHCECGKGWSGHLCGTDVNECESNKCQHKSTCENTIGSFRCHCTDGWTGAECEEDVDECVNVNCYGNSTCQNTNGSFYCSCEAGFSGQLCEVDVDECNSSPCLNGAICQDRINGFVCECAKGYTGLKCQKEIDECKGVNDQFVIYLDQKVTPAVRKEIVSRVKHLINKYAGYGVDSLDIYGSAEWLKNNEGDMVSNVSLSLSINGTKVCGENLEELRSLMTKGENDFPFKLYNGSIAGLRQPEAIVERQKMPKKAWFKDNWYLLMIAVGLVVLIAIVLFVLLRYNRKKQRHVSNGQSYMDNTFQWQPGHGAMNTLPSLAFDNDIYQSATPEHQLTFRPQDKTFRTDQTQVEEQPLTFENDIYRRATQEEQDNLMNSNFANFEDAFQ
ncbi:delta-like protein D isoform X4 [Mytilus californianus]|uniref:delta-like protein D isoform X4 n=1 Tax=Mytilus californianus TaxID=6549 RepID=UPI002246F7D8|nr:delta-like protein D isoform X4 [Mytilus californianus]